MDKLKYRETIYVYLFSCLGKSRTERVHLFHEPSSRMQFTFYFICCVVRATKFLDLPFIVNKKFIIKNFASYNVIKESVFSSFSLGKA